MVWLKHSVVILAVVLMLAIPTGVRACPLWVDIPAASGTDGEDAANSPAAYNQSIYLMVGVPYLSFGVLAFLIYRGCKKNEAYKSLQRSQASGAA